MVVIHTNSELDKLRESGRIVALVHEKLKESIRPGISTLDINNIAEKIIMSENGLPAFKGYRGYPFATCCSVNATIVHGFPSKYILKDGDILSIDVGVLKEGFYGDAAFTIGIGTISTNAKRLIDTSKNALNTAISNIKEGVTTGTIGRIIEEYSQSRGFFVVKNYIGHGIGRQLHMEPAVYNYGRDIDGIKLKAGMCICIEPMLCVDSAENYKLKDGWTVVTKNGKLSAHDEHQIIVHKNNAEIITRSINVFI